MWFPIGFISALDKITVGMDVKNQSADFLSIFSRLWYTHVIRIRGCNWTYFEPHRLAEVLWPLKIICNLDYYTPGIYAEGYIVFVFPFVCSFVRTSVPFVELLQSFTFKQLEWNISHQPLIRKHSYLDHRYPVGSAFIPWLLTPGSMPRVGARGQNLGHL